MHFLTRFLTGRVPLGTAGKDSPMSNFITVGDYTINVNYIIGYHVHSSEQHQNGIFSSKTVVTDKTLFIRVSGGLDGRGEIYELHRNDGYKVEEIKKNLDRRLGAQLVG